MQRRPVSETRLSTAFGAGKSVTDYSDVRFSILITGFVSRRMDIGDAVGFCGVIALHHLTSVNPTLKLNIVAKLCVTSFIVSKWFIICRITNQ